MEERSAGVCKSLGNVNSRSHGMVKRISDGVEEMDSSGDDALTRKSFSATGADFVPWNGMPEHCEPGAETCSMLAVNDGSTSFSQFHFDHPL